MKLNLTQFSNLSSIGEKDRKGNLTGCTWEQPGSPSLLPLPLTVPYLLQLSKKPTSLCISTENDLSFPVYKEHLFPFCII